MSKHTLSPSSPPAKHARLEHQESIPSSSMDVDQEESSSITSSYRLSSNRLELFMECLLRVKENSPGQEIEKRLASIYGAFKSSYKGFRTDFVSEDVFTENAIREGEHFFNVLRRAVREGATEDDHQAVVTHNVFWPSLPPIDEGTAHEIAPPPVTPVPPILPTMSMLSINCLLLGTDSSKVFAVKIPKTDSVGILKRLIKEEQSRRLNYVDASDLTVWKVSLPADAISPELTVGGAKALSPLEKISSIFGEALVDEHVHILVQAPAASQPVAAPDPAQLLSLNCSVLRVDGKPNQFFT
ncbi:hypothetical protein B0F90DRAFT_1914380, partial [Multifurca ochricompacta]